MILKKTHRILIEKPAKYILKLDFAVRGGVSKV